MVSYDLDIRGGKVFTPSGILNALVCIDDGKIVALEKENVQFSRSIDATGCIILPGSIDCHVHFAIRV